VNREITRSNEFEFGTDRVIGALIEVHRRLGPGLLESAYEACLAAELKIRGLAFVRQVPLPIDYKGIRLECSYRLDFIVEGQILIELKTVERLMPIHEAQVITYLRLARLPVGLLTNFNVFSIKRGLRRLTPWRRGSTDSNRRDSGKDEEEIEQGDREKKSEARESPGQFQEQKFRNY
jgi:GxxExxY protein